MTNATARDAITAAASAHGWVEAPYRDGTWGRLLTRGDVQILVRYTATGAVGWFTVNGEDGLGKGMRARLLDLLARPA